MIDNFLCSHSSQCTECNMYRPSRHLRSPIYFESFKRQYLYIKLMRIYTACIVCARESAACYVPVVSGRKKRVASRKSVSRRQYLCNPENISDNYSCNVIYFCVIIHSDLIQIDFYAMQEIGDHALVPLRMRRAITC